MVQYNELNEPLPSEYNRVDIDLAKPKKTIPWVADCQACDLRQKFTDAISEIKVWFPELADHFWRQHKIELWQYRGSPKLGVLQPIEGPFERIEYAVRFRVVMPDSPIVGQVTFDGCVNKEIAQRQAKLFADRPDAFDSVAVVKRTVTVTEWK